MYTGYQVSTIIFRFFFIHVIAREMPCFCFSGGYTCYYLLTLAASCHRVYICTCAVLAYDDPATLLSSRCGSPPSPLPFAVSGIVYDLAQLEHNGTHIARLKKNMVNLHLHLDSEKFLGVSCSFREISPSVGARAIELGLNPFSNRTVQDSTALFRVVPHCTGQYRTAQGSTALQWAVPHCIGQYRTVQGGTALFMAVPHCSEQYRIV